MNNTHTLSVNFACKVKKQTCIVWLWQSNLAFMYKILEVPTCLYTHSILYQSNSQIINFHASTKHYYF